MEVVANPVVTLVSELQTVSFFSVFAGRRYFFGNRLCSHGNLGLLLSTSVAFAPSFLAFCATILVAVSFQAPVLLSSDGLAYIAAISLTFGSLTKQTPIVILFSLSELESKPSWSSALIMSRFSIAILSRLFRLFLSRRIPFVAIMSETTRSEDDPLMDYSDSWSVEAYALCLLLFDSLFSDISPPS